MEQAETREGQDSPPDSGSLDKLSDGWGRSDRALLAKAIRQGWQITPERKRQYFAALDEIIRHHDPSDPRSSAAVAQAAKILQLEQAAALKDLHLLEDRDRMDSGKPTQAVKGIVGVDVDTAL